MKQTILAAWGLEGSSVAALGSGLINHTWKVSRDGQDYVLQRINETVFRRPQDIAHNLRELGDFLQQHSPGYLFVAPLPALNGEDLLSLPGEGFFRLFPFVSGSHTIDVVISPGQAYEAARQFAGFTSHLEGLPLDRLRITIPRFHDLAFRFSQFEEARVQGNPDRIREAGAEIKALSERSAVVDRFRALCSGSDFKLRVMHHDTKISNVLFDSAGRGLAVIDLDTVMPGYFVSDVGDMLRTYLSPVSEEERDTNRVESRYEYFEAIREGYLEKMGRYLTPTEKEQFGEAGRIMIYMQALRFLTDFLQNDIYYGEKYAGHNLTRARNQLVLLDRLEQQILRKR